MPEPITPELVLCVPGPWKDRADFIRAIVSATRGEYLFAGMVLANPTKEDHIPLHLMPRSSGMRTAFEIAGHAKLSESVLDDINQHQSTAFLHFPVQIISQRERVASFCRVLQQAGGIAVKVESAGVAHEWNIWFAILASENLFDLYRSFVVLIADKAHYYSCGMHHFNLPDVEVSKSTEIKEAADLMNQFNYWQIVEEPKIAPGHTFSIKPDSTRYKITRLDDTRHKAEDLFHNANGIWRLTQTNG